MTEIMTLQNVSVHFPVRGALPFLRKGEIQAVSDVSLSIHRGEIFGIVGESGCGKTTLASAMVGMIKPTAGQVLFEGVDLNRLPRDEFKKMRRRMQMIFQDPFSSLNPRFNVYQIVSEPMLIRGEDDEETMKARVVELLELVGLSSQDLYRYPSDFSGGQRQRLGIARAISLNPSFLVCDEPVSALDVSIHAQILNLLLELQEKLNLTYVFISHNLADVKKMCDHLAVMYLGKVMEAGNSDKIFANPMHPYTQALIAAILDIDFSEEREIIVLPGDTPSPINPPSGCRFWQRCPKAMRGCREVPPEYVEVEPDHFVACHLVNGFPDQELPEGYDQPMVPREKVPGR
ncbi:MAG: ABC transporter ATP-binding protein [Limnochordia bacterium]|nr:ABC transporter ATP-binding protein [Bacillota bacterium]